jgi:methionyl-tRNA formyltransferase
MIRVGIVAPTDISLLARLLADWSLREPGIELGAIVARRMFSWPRIRSELRRDGRRLLRKFWRKAVLDGDDTDTTSSLNRLMTDRPIDSKLSALCEAHGIPFARVSDLNEHLSVDTLRAANLDMIVFAGGGILREPLLRLTPLGVLNAHMGILPHYRGMDVVEWALLEGASAECGLTVHRMDTGIDTGPIFRKWYAHPAPGESIAAIRSRIEVAMVSELVATIRDLRDGAPAPIPQAIDAGRQYFIIHPRLLARIS